MPIGIRRICSSMRAPIRSSLYVLAETTLSMVLGALILCGVLWTRVGWTMTVWLAAILCLGLGALLVRAYRRAQPLVGTRGAGESLGHRLDHRGRIVGAAAITMFGVAAVSALFIVCRSA
jgi:hypothetical protein